MAKTGKKKKAKKPAAWRVFELEVASIYRAKGAINVADNVNMDGNQIDVYAELPLAGGIYVRTIISCKNYATPAGVDDVRDWNNVFLSLRQKADMAFIVSAAGFTQDAAPLAKANNIQLIRIEQLRLESSDFVTYVQKQLKDFEDISVFAENKYISPRAVVEGQSRDFPAEKIVVRFLTKSDSALLTLLGDFGIGKTTFMQHLFIKLAKEYLQNPLESVLPIYASLRNYPDTGKLAGLFADLLVNQFHCRFSGYETLAKMASDGTVVFLFDAFDEMANRMELASTLQHFDALKTILKDKAKAILTCRTHYFKDQDELHRVQKGTELFHRARQQHYEIAYLQALNNDEIKAYLKAAFGKDWQRHHQTIQDTYNLWELSKRPLLLEMITATLNKLTQNKVFNSVDLYNQYTNDWLEREDWKKPLTKKDRLNFTRLFAYSIYEKNVSSFSQKELESAIKKKYGSLADVENYEYDIRVCTFIKRNPATEEYTFAHQSFCEYFVATHLYEMLVRGDLSCLKDRLHEPAVLHFLSEHLGTSDIVKSLIKEISIKGGKSPNFIANALFLLGKWSGPVRSLTVNQLTFSKLSITGLRLIAVLFDGCIFDNSKLLKSNSEGCSIIDSKLISCLINSCNFSSCSLVNTSLDHVLVESSRFDNTTSVVNVVGSKFNNCKVKECIFTNSNFSDSGFEFCHFEDVDFSSAVLERLYFSNCTFSKTKWPEQIMSQVDFRTPSFKDDVSCLVIPQHIVGRVDAKRPITVSQADGLSDSIKNQLDTACGVIFSS